MGRPKMYDENLRERLITEAHNMMATEGYSSVSLRVLTKNVGTSTNAVYTLFGSKEALMAEAITIDLDKKINAIFELSPCDDPFEDMLQIVQRYRKLAIDTPHIFSSAFTILAEARRTPVSYARSFSDMTHVEDKVFAPLLNVCRRVVEHTECVKINASHMGLALWSLVHGLISLENSGMMEGRTEDLDAFYLDALHSFYKGWTTPSDESVSESQMNKYNLIIHSKDLQAV